MNHSPLYRRGKHLRAACQPCQEESGLKSATHTKKRFSQAAAAAALFEAARACAAGQGLLLPQVRVLLAMVASGVGDEHTPQRLGAVLRQMVGTPAQIAALTLGRDGAPTVDVAALLAVP